MAKLPPYSNLQLQDPAVPVWFRPFLVALNAVLASLIGILNRNLTFEDNFASQAMELRYYGGTAVKIATTLRQPVKMILVQQIAGDGPVTGGVTVVWQQINEVIEISQITGLTAGAGYNLRLLLL